MLQNAKTALTSDHVKCELCARSFNDIYDYYYMFGAIAITTLSIALTAPALAAAAPSVTKNPHRSLTKNRFSFSHLLVRLQHISMQDDYRVRCICVISVDLHIVFSHFRESIGDECVAVPTLIIRQKKRKTRKKKLSQEKKNHEIESRKYEEKKICRSRAFGAIFLEKIKSHNTFKIQYYYYCYYYYNRSWEKCPAHCRRMYGVVHSRIERH